MEVFATSLHYAPCGVDGQGFQVAIVLPQGTNYPLQGTHQKVDHGRAPSEDALLAATNKWLIGHAEGGLSEGSFIGLIGENWMSTNSRHDVAGFDAGFHSVDGRNLR